MNKIYGPVYPMLFCAAQDVTQCTLEEVAGLLRGPAGSKVELTFLETRAVKLEMERC